MDTIHFPKNHWHCRHHINPTTENIPESEGKIYHHVHLSPACDVGNDDSSWINIRMIVTEPCVITDLV
jgi:hypothetical protein